MTEQNKVIEAFLPPEKLSELRKVVEDTTAEFITQLPQLIYDKLEQSVAGMLGFSRDSWKNNWQIDHCNGRMGEVSVYISDHAKSVAKEAVAGLTWSPDKEMLTAMNNEFANKVTEAIKNGINKKAAEVAAEMVSSILEEYITNVGGKFEVATPTVQELTDPCYYTNKPLYKAIVENIVRREMEKKP